MSKPIDPATLNPGDRGWVCEDELDAWPSEVVIVKAELADERRQKIGNDWTPGPEVIGYVSLEGWALKGQVPFGRDKIFATPEDALVDAAQRDVKHHAPRLERARAILNAIEAGEKWGGPVLEKLLE